VSVDEYSLYQQRFAYDSDNQLQYLGLALGGTATSVNRWQIREFSYVASNLVSILLADGDLEFDNIWDDRATLSYS